MATPKTVLQWRWLLVALTGLVLIFVVPQAHAESFLWDAISESNIDKARMLIALGADVNYKNRYEHPVLSHAAHKGNAEIVELLIAKGADVNAKGRFDQTPLHWTIKKEIASILLARGARVDAIDKKRETALHWAAGSSGVEGAKEGTMVEVAEVLLSHGADVNKQTGAGQSPLHLAAAWNKLQMARLLIRHGADVNAATAHFGVGASGSPLGAASTNWDNVEMAELLVAHGAQINPANTDPPLASAARRQVKIVTFLLSRGADPNARNRGVSPLDWAAGSDFGAPCAEVLLKHGADPNARSAFGQTALHQAAAQGSYQVAKVLVAHKADVNATDKTGNTPLHGAIRYGHRATHEAGSGIKDGSRRVVDLLLDNGAAVNVIGSGESPLHLAITQKDVELVRLLIARGADVNAKRTFGDSALSLARNSKAIEQVLREHGAR